MQVSVNFFTPGPQLIYAVNKDTGRDLMCLSDIKWFPAAATCKLYMVPADKIGFHSDNKFDISTAQAYAYPSYGLTPSIDYDAGIIKITGTYNRSNATAGFQIVSQGSVQGQAGDVIRCYDKNADALAYFNGANPVRWTNSSTYKGFAIDLKNLSLNAQVDIQFRVGVFGRGVTPPAEYEPYFKPTEVAGSNIHMGGANAGDLHLSSWRTAFKFEDIPFTQEGLHAACVEVTDSGKTITSLPFYLAVERSIE